MTGSLFAFVHSRERQRVQEICNAALALLDSSAPPDLSSFMVSDSYSIATKAMAGVFGRHYDLAAHIVFDAGPLLIFKLATAFRAIRVSNGRGRWPVRKRFTLEDLREIAASKKHPIIAKRARMALAAYGEIDWPAADRPMRAVFLFAEIVRRRHRL